MSCWSASSVPLFVCQQSSNEKLSTTFQSFWWSSTGDLHHWHVSNHLYYLTLPKWNNWNPHNMYPIIIINNSLDFNSSSTIYRLWSSKFPHQTSDTCQQLSLFIHEIFYKCGEIFRITEENLHQWSFVAMLCFISQFFVYHVNQVMQKMDSHSTLINLGQCIWFINHRKLN